MLFFTFCHFYLADDLMVTVHSTLIGFPALLFIEAGHGSVSLAGECPQRDVSQHMCLVTLPSFTQQRRHGSGFAVATLIF